MTDFFSTNTFDLAVYVCLFVAVVMGFMAGLLRGLATIFDYICGIGNSVPDRVAGAALGAIRIAMLAILLVLVFDRIIPPGREPAFLKGSQWRPVLSSAAQYGLQSLPPAAENYIDRLKRQRRL